jgi:hypothetical protein
MPSLPATAIPVRKAQYRPALPFALPVAEGKQHFFDLFDSMSLGPRMIALMITDMRGIVDHRKKKILPAQA